MNLEVPSRRGRRRRLGVRLGAAALAAAAAIPALTACSDSYEAGVINIYAPADGFDFITQVAETCSADSGGQYRIATHMLPKEADGQRLQLARRLAGNDHRMDLMAMDVVWTAEFADADWLVPVPDDLAAALEKTNLGGPLETAKWQREDDAAKRLYAVPIWTNTQLLWYRPDLMRTSLGSAKPPQTWDEMLSDTKRIGEAGGPRQILLQAKQYEGLMVWFNSLLASAGGSVLDPDDPTKVTLTDTPEHRAATVEALRVMKAVATAPGHDPSITNSDESSARTGMERGDGAFEINWPFVFAGARENGVAGEAPFLGDSLVRYRSIVEAAADNPTDPQLETVNNALRKRFNFALYPGISDDLPARSTPGGLNIGVASTSKQADLAFTAAKCLTSADAQKIYAVQGGTPPTIASLYDDPDFKIVYPMGDDIRDQLEADRAAPRPASPRYQEISTAVTAALSPVGSWNPEKMADELATQVKRAVKGEGIVP
ncbi:extracellular solute-binding protein [Gordonia sp. VNK21]|uniref:extracellular solute-binding protein n=1 Tax=Gordonia sp. VNK21 TaxID=3382483 RepID=UPI0038D51351